MCSYYLHSGRLVRAEMDYRKYKSFFSMCAVIFIAIGLINIVLYRNAATLTIAAPTLSNPEYVRGLESLSVRQTTAKQAVPTYNAVVDENRIKHELEASLRAASEEKIILLWSHAGGLRSDPVKPNRTECGNCKITYDRSYIKDKRTGAVLYHFGTMKKHDMITKRNPHHLHIFMYMESSATLKNAGYTLETEENFGMNATFCYRRDCDFLGNYGMETLHTKMEQDKSIYQDIMQSKSKLAIAVISDCKNTFGARWRIALIEQLKDLGLRIDTYGSCYSNRISDDALKEAIPQYKFYFAYENSYHCKDYITEKFFTRALSQNIVPVVWGARKKDYDAVAPPGSFIHAEMFESPKKLVEYLDFLDKNDDKYMKYFRWRTMSAESLPQYGRKLQFCSICRALHGINLDYRFSPTQKRLGIPLFSNGAFRRVVPSLQRFVYDEENPECFKV